MEHDKNIVASSWTAERLRSVTKTYASLEPKTRIRILASFLHLPLRTYAELQSELTEFIKLGLNDSDPWIRSISSVISTLPERGCLNETSLPDVNSKETNLVVYPLDTMYLTRLTSSSLFGSSTAPVSRLMSPQTPGSSANVPAILPHHQLVKHFALRRKPKSAELRAQLVQKSADSVGSSRLTTGSSSGPSSMSTCPIKMRSFAKKMTGDSGRGFDGFLPSSRMQSSSNYAMSGNRQHAASVSGGSGVKVLELSDLPMNLDPRKRHRASIQETKLLERQKSQNSPKNEPTEMAKTDSTAYGGVALLSPTELKSRKKRTIQEKPQQKADKKIKKSEVESPEPEDQSASSVAEKPLLFPPQASLPVAQIPETTEPKHNNYAECEAQKQAQEANDAIANLIEQPENDDIPKLLSNVQQASTSVLSQLGSGLGLPPAAMPIQPGVFPASAMMNTVGIPALNIGLEQQQQQQQQQVTLENGSSTVPFKLIRVQKLPQTVQQQAQLQQQQQQQQPQQQQNQQPHFLQPGLAFFMNQGPNVPR